jgi:hypothetical protein
MTSVSTSGVSTLALLEQRFAGDGFLMKLASRRFAEAAMGAEMHGGTTDHLNWVLSFRPFREAPVVIHLPRDFNIAEETSCRRVLDLARHFRGQTSGFVLHDHRDLVERPEEYLEAARRLNTELEKIEKSPVLFIEYAAGLPPKEFARFFRSTLDLARVAPCVDVGHVGIRTARAVFAQQFPGEDVCAVKSQPERVPQLMPHITAAVEAGSEATIELIEELAELKKPIHFHLHDGHPLSTFSPFGVSDHLSFLAKIPLAFEYRGRRAAATIFGPAGLSRIVASALKHRSAPVSFTLEIHPTGEQLALGAASALFSHWTDKTNAEKMNHWLSLLVENHKLLVQAIQGCSKGGVA